MELKILIFGDIFGKPGRTALKQLLPKLKAETHADLVIANGENLAHGMGCTQTTLKECMDAGVDAFTGGNDMWSKPEVETLLAGKGFPLIRPANYPEGTPGAGHMVLEVGTKKVLLINLMGRVFMHVQLDCPFRAVDAILKNYKNETFAAILVDIHAEATSEKTALGHYLDGRVSCVYGTHTHIPTADSRILTAGTGYCTDVGFTGPMDSVIGVRKDIIIQKFLTQRPKAHLIAESGVAEAHYLLATIDTTTKKTTSLTQHYREFQF